MSNRRTGLAGALALFRNTLLGQKGGASAATGPVAFGYKMAWLAVKTVRTADLVSCLKLEDRSSATWPQGVEAAYDPKRNLVFVTPPVEGWTFVVGRGTFPDDKRSLQNIVGIVRELSSTFGEAQGFASHRVIEYHHWILARNGHIERCYAYTGEQGEVLANTGPITESERKLAFSNLPGDKWTPNESDVMGVAGGWSVDPTKLTADSGPAEFGVIGRR
jgi:hypothetical protein